MVQLNATASALAEKIKKEGDIEAVAICTLFSYIDPRHEMRVRDIFAGFEDKDPRSNMGRGDVKYHMGFSTDRKTASGKDLHMTLAFNPSHLEWVNPVVEGRVRAKQDRKGDKTRARVLPLLIHGDSAFIGQGVVAETLNLSEIGGYRTGGTVHVIINNQVGFTTNPEDARSTRYCTDITRMPCPWRQCVTLFTEELLADFSAERGMAVVEEIRRAGGEAHFCQIDVAQADQVKAMVAQAVTLWGGLDVMVNNAGWTHRNRPALEVSAPMPTCSMSTRGKSVSSTSVTVSSPGRKVNR